MDKVKPIALDIKPVCVFAMWPDIDREIRVFARDADNEVFTGYTVVTIMGMSNACAQKISELQNILRRHPDKEQI